MNLKSEELTKLVAERLRSNSATLDLAAVATFCDVSRGTLDGWLNGKMPLGGRTTLKLWHLLALAGIESPELDQARQDYPIGEYIGRLLAHGLLEMSEVREMCGNVQENAIYRAARTEGRLSYCTKTLDDLRDDYDEFLELAESELRTTLGPDKGSQSEKPSMPMVSTEVGIERQPQIQAVASSSGTSDWELLELAKLLLAALAAGKFAAANLTPEQRRKLRSYMGERGMFDLSNVIDQLCSERAFHEGDTN